MKLLRIRTGPRKEIPAVLMADGSVLDCSQVFTDWNADFFRDNGLQNLREALASDPTQFPKWEKEIQYGSPIARPGKIVCVGLNYRDHAKEAGQPIPQEPILFMKASSSHCGPFDPIIKPRGSTKLDWEVELGIVIGRDCRYAPSEDEAVKAIAGFVVVNDVSERAFQLERGGQWTKGKSHDHFSPVGPYLVTRDEVQDTANLNLTLSVNGQTKQSGHTGQMIFSVPHLIHYISQFMTLEAGDLVSTGTPPGVAAGMKDPTWLQTGDVVELSVSGLGTQRQTVISDEH